MSNTDPAIVLYFGIAYLIASLIPFYVYFAKKKKFLKGFLIIFQLSACLRGAMMILKAKRGLNIQLETFTIILEIAVYCLCIFSIVISQNLGTAYITTVDAVVLIGFIFVLGITGTISLSELIECKKYTIYITPLIVIGYSYKLVTNLSNTMLKLAVCFICTLLYIFALLVFIMSGLYSMVFQELFLHTCIVHLQVLSFFHVDVKREYAVEQLTVVTPSEA